MASTAQPITQTQPPLPAVQRYFEVSLFLLVATGLLAIVSTGKLDIFSTVITSVALAYKALAHLASQRPGAFVAHRHRTRAGLLFIFPVRYLGPLARPRAGRAQPRALRRIACSHSPADFRGAGASLFRAHQSRLRVPRSASPSRPCSPPRFSPSKPAFLIALAIFLVLAVSTFVALDIRRSSTGAVTPPFDAGSPTALQLNRALGITSVLVAVSALLLGGVIFFLIPRFTTGYLSALNLQPTLMTGFSGQCGARRNRQDQAEHRGRDAHSRRR